MLSLVDEILVSCVAKHEIDDRPPHDHKTGERLGPHLVSIGRRTQCEAMARYQLFERALIRLARGKNNGSGPRDPIIYIRRHGTSQIHQDHHLEACVDKEQESQVYYCSGADSMAATHGDDILAEGEPGELDRLGEVSKRLVVVEVLDRIRPGGEVHGQYLKRHILHIEDHGLETSCCDHQKPFQGWCEQSLGRSDPETLDELAELDVCVSSGRFDMQFCVKRLSAMMSKPRKMKDLRLSRCVV